MTGQDRASDAAASAQAVVTLRFSPAPEHVRTARLVAVSIARRHGLDEAGVDGVRLAVGELCARAVLRTLRIGAGDPVALEIDDSAPGLSITVTDSAHGPEDDAGLALEVVRGLAHSVSVADGPGGSGGRVNAWWSGDFGQ